MEGRMEASALSETRLQPGHARRGALAPVERCIKHPCRETPASLAFLLILYPKINM